MSVESIHNFYLMLLRDPKLKKELKVIKEKLIKGKLSPENAIQFIEEGLIPIAKKWGFSFTVDDVIDYKSKQHSDILKKEKQKLSNEKLGNISGGLEINNKAFEFVDLLFSKL